jgi:hypothetical protein
MRRRFGDVPLSEVVYFAGWSSPPSARRQRSCSLDSPRASAVTDYLSDYEQFMSHGRRVDRDALRTLGVNVTDLESDQRLQDLVLSVHHVINRAMNLAGITELVENHNGNAFMRRTIGIMIAGGPQAASPQGGSVYRFHRPASCPQVPVWVRRLPATGVSDGLRPRERGKRSPSPKRVRASARLGNPSAVVA